MTRRLLAIFAFIALTATAGAQESSNGFWNTLKSGFGLFSNSNEKEMRNNVRRGNMMMKAGQRDKAYELYRKAYEADSTNTMVNYNLGTAMFPDEWKIMPTDSTRDKSMLKHFTLAAGHEDNKMHKAQAFHNMGVLYQTRANQSKDQNAKNQLLMQAIEAYKNALRNNPRDDEARYNMVLCQRQLPKGGGGGGGNDQQEDKDKDKEQEKKDEQKKDEQQPQQPKKEPQNNQQQDKDWIDQMLNAAEQREKQVRNKIDEYQQKNNQNRPRRNLKNW